MTKYLIKALLSIIVYLLFSTNILAEEKYEIRIIIDDLQNSNGYIRAALYNSKENYEKSREKPYKTESVRITNNKAQVIFQNVPVGVYAIAILHDENNNGKMDRNFLGIPKEGFGFSNNPKVLFGAPKFDEIKFDLNKNLVINIKIKYY